MFDLKSYIIGMVCMGLLTLFDRSIISYLKNSTIILIGYIKGRSRKYDKLGA